MDGSRRTYKINDIQIDSHILPVIAGQVGVAVCERDEKKRLSPCRSKLHIVAALPRNLDKEGKNEKQEKAYFADLADKLGHGRIKLDSILAYKASSDENYEDKAVARIQEHMIEREKEMVQELVNANLLSDGAYLVKDGSLEYSKISDKEDRFAFNKIRNNYKHIIGVSKSFNPELVKLDKNKSAAQMIANLKPYQRTPAAMYKTERVDGKFSVWYLRLREARKMRGPFDGVVKVEKILVSDAEETNGLDTGEVDRISAWLMNERNPVCYGKDNRWANHLYPIYLTERYIKSQYIETLHFTNLF